MNLIQQQIYKSQLDILTLNIRQLEGELEKTATFLRSISTDESLLGAYASNDETDQYFAAVTYSQDIQDSIIYFDYVEGILCYAVDTGKTLYCYTDYSSNYPERMSVIDEVKEQADDSNRGSGKKWTGTDTGK
ncbi:MAG: hypothetical protein LIP12_11665 [Clostridiales bacterium]|nr:hypothetical protein [Clostridiales bacterium]